MSIDIKVEGTQEVAANILAAKDKTFAKVLRAVETSAIHMTKHAAAGHERGSNPHARDRFETQTANLVNSLMPGGPGAQQMKWDKITEDEIVGLFGVNQAAPGNPMEYALHVEFGTRRSRAYPFIWPAVAANLADFKRRVAAAAPGGVGSVER